MASKTWDSFHRRGEVLRAVVEEANARRDGVLPMELPGVAETFGDEFSLIAALQLRWHTRLAGRIERALMEQPMDLESAVLSAWRGAATELAGVRRILDAYTAHPTSQEMAEALRTSHRKDWTLMAAMAGRASINDERAERVGPSAARSRPAARSANLARLRPPLQPRLRRRPSLPGVAAGASPVRDTMWGVATQPSISYSITVRLEVPAGGTAISRLTTAVEDAGGVVTALDVTASGHDRLRIDVTCAAADTSHAEQIVEDLRLLDGLVVHKVSDRTFLMHLGGTIEMASKHPIRNRDDLSMVYTPGVARVCEAIAANPEDARRLTVKRNSVAVVTDGSAVLGLGNIGPAAALPVMEGKAALFKRFAGIDAWPLCLDTQDPDEIVEHRPGGLAGLRRASTSRTSPRRAASRSRPGCARSSTSRSSTTTSTAPRSSCSPRSPTRCGWSARTSPTSAW